MDSESRVSNVDISVDTFVTVITANAKDSEVIKKVHGFWVIQQHFEKSKKVINLVTNWTHS